MDDQPINSYEQKLEVLQQLRELTPEQMVAFLDGLNPQWNVLIDQILPNWRNLIFPGPALPTIDCIMPRNSHKPQGKYKYICQNTDPTIKPPGQHTFCLNHLLVKTKCPIDGTDLQKRLAP